MTATYQALALATAAAGLVSLVVATVGGRWREGLRMALDLWLAAGLLRLSADPDWDAILAAAGVVAVRELVGYGLRHSPVLVGR